MAKRKSKSNREYADDNDYHSGEEKSEREINEEKRRDRTNADWW
jgi:hypothetical protein